MTSNNMDKKIAGRVLAAVEAYAGSGHGDVKKLRGVENQWRLRVGEWRVRFTRMPQERLIIVLRVLPRGEAYRR